MFAEYDIAIYGSEIHTNTAAGNYAAVYAYGRLLCSNSIIHSNFGGSNYGPLYSAKTLSIYNSSIYSNIAGVVY